MSSEFFMFENSFLSEPFSPFFTDNYYSTNDDHIFQTISNTFIDNNETNYNTFQQTSHLDDDHNNNNNNISLQQISSLLLSSSSSSSPPSHQLQNLSLSQTTTMDAAIMEVKSEECNLPFDSYNNNSYDYSNSFVYTHDNDGVKMMQRSYSSNSFDNKRNFLFKPCFDSLVESSNFQNYGVSSPESSFSSTQMRRVCSTGDLHKMKATPTRSILSSSPLSTERSFIEDAANMKAIRYSAEERKEKIDRYRAKRTQRNFNKTIKYVCRKTLADTRPRIRGRFARNDEAAAGGGEIPKTPIIFNTSTYEDDKDPWVDKFHEEANYRSTGRASFFKRFNSTEDQYYIY